MFETENLRHYMMSGEWIGWVATACFTLSYVVKKERNLLLVQSIASSIWLVYGLIIHATPMVVANAIVAGAAGSKAIRVTLNGQKSEKL